LLRSVQCNSSDNPGQFPSIDSQTPDALSLSRRSERRDSFALDSSAVSHNLNMRKESNWYSTRKKKKEKQREKKKKEKKEEKKERKKKKGEKR
jgi:hypothetical protein